MTSGRKERDARLSALVRALGGRGASLREKLGRALKRAGDLGWGADAPLVPVSLSLEEHDGPSLFRATIGVSAALVLGFVLWAGVAEIDEVSVAEGVVMPSGRNQVVQHLEGGIVEQVRVSEGELVEAGQTLIVLAAAAPSADFAQIEAKLAALELQVERLRALETGAPLLSGWAAVQYPELALDQAKLLKAERKARVSQRIVLESQLRNAQGEIRVLHAQRTTIERELPLVQEELRMRETLYQKGLGSKLLYLQVQQRVAKVEGELREVAGRASRAEESVAEVEARLADQEAQWQSEGAKERGRVTAEAAQVRELYAKARDRVERLEVKSPVRGVIKDLAVNSSGAVIQPGQAVLEIVPVDEVLVVEARIPPQEAGLVRPGQPARVMLTSYDYVRYGAIPGRLKSVSASTFQDKDGRPYYKGIVHLSQPYAGDSPLNTILPGMTAEVGIRTGDRSVLAYLLKPIYRTLNQGLQER